MTAQLPIVSSLVLSRFLIMFSEIYSASLEGQDSVPLDYRLGVVRAVFALELPKAILEDLPTAPENESAMTV